MKMQLLFLRDVILPANPKNLQHIPSPFVLILNVTLIPAS